MKKSFTFLILIILFFSNFSYANNYITKNGYEVELYWKVKHRREIIVWGSIQDGKNCKQLKMHISMENENGRYESFYYTFNTPHTRSSRSPFRLIEKSRSKNLPKNGWFPDRISVSCSNFYRKK